MKDDREDFNKSKTSIKNSISELINELDKALQIKDCEIQKNQATFIGPNHDYSIIAINLINKYLELEIFKFEEIAKDAFYAYGEKGLRKIFQPLKAAYVFALLRIENPEFSSFDTVKNAKVEDFLD